MDLVKQYATPRSNKKLSTAKLDRARAMFNRGYTQAQIAEALGVSTNTLMSVLDLNTNEEGGD